MPDDLKKNDRKNAKEQRKPRQRHQPGPKTEKKPEKTEDSNNAPQVPQKPPVYESPPQEFFKNLKRETDEILKITEEENSKYKKKEIQSNWSKYEVPIESYDEIDEQENMGADFEKLVQAPPTTGAHFQFKHEKSWDLNTSPTQYDKYFDIDMEDLNTALCAIPFHERIYFEQSIFKESDILTMNNRATRFKQKYYKDKSFSTPETEVHDKILNSLRDDITIDVSTKLEEKSQTDVTKNNQIAPETKVTNSNKDANLDIKSESHNTVNDNKEIEHIANSENVLSNAEPVIELKETAIDEIEHNDFIFRVTEKPTNLVEAEQPEKSVNINKIPELKATYNDTNYQKKLLVDTNVAAAVEAKVTHAVPSAPVETNKNTIIESPEDLEKWLDDFLDG